jgi:uncharacterized protein YuzE
MPMTVRIGQHEFDDVSYDANGDVLYLSADAQADADAGDGTREGHFVRFDEDGRVVAVTLVNARWLIDRDGKLTVTLPGEAATELDGKALAPALSSAGR